MAELDKQEKIVVNGNKEEEERLLEGMTATALDFDMLCSTVASQTRGKWRELDSPDNCSEQGNDEFVGVFRMWEGEVIFDFMDDRRVALESACCPCYRFGKNMRRTGLGYCFLQGTVYFILVVAALLLRAASHHRSFFLLREWEADVRVQSGKGNNGGDD